MIPFGGTVEGELFHGKVLAGGVDTQTVDQNGVRHMSARYMLEGVDNAGEPCHIYIDNNGWFVGHHESGYSGFRYDITDVVEIGGRNVVAVRVDATLAEGWFYEGAGIYRHAWLVKHDPLHVPEYGVAVRTEMLTGEDRFGWTKAHVVVATDVANGSAAPAGGMLSTRVIGPDGKAAGEADAVPFTLTGRETQTLAQAVVVDKPRVWSPDAPNLYTLVTVISRGGKAVDSVATTFGIRTVVFDRDSGFFINGAHLKIIAGKKPLCLHMVEASKK